MPAKNNQASMPARIVRCACYTRKSTEEGLEQEFNSLDAQREAAEAYIKSQLHEGWTCLPERYDDGGFTGANMERPALKRLLTDVETGKVDCILVYKVDRLSRSLLDFARLMETFDKHQIAFVSVTQQFNTASSMGRLVLNVLLSFAQFEREIISERTRDKIAAARRKGKWSGGMPILGYDVDERSKLIVNEEEARRVRAIFDLYLAKKGMIPVVQELERLGWCNKRWTTRKGQPIGGKPFTKTTLHHLLTNVAYVGQVKYKSEVHKGEHAGIVAAKTWQRAQAKLRHHNVSGAGKNRKPGDAVLQGLIRCVPCGCAMTPSQTKRHGRQYRYYTCSSAQKRGWHTCPSKSVRAEQLENFVIQQLRLLGNEPAHATSMFAAAETQSATPANEDPQQLEWERQALLRDLAAWEILPPRAQARLIKRLVARVDYDGSKDKITLTLHTGGEAKSAPATVECAIHCERRGHGASRLLKAGNKILSPALPPGRVPRVARLMALAIRFDRMLRLGTVTDYAALAKLGHVSRARISQIMNLLLLAPDIQERLLHLPRLERGHDPLRMAHLQPIALTWDWRRQRRLWTKIAGSMRDQ